MNNTQKTIRCGVIKDLLPLYADGVLSDESRELVEAHLAGCADCRKLAEQMAAEIAAPAKAEEIDVLKRIKKGVRKGWKKAFFKGIAACLAALLLAFTGYFVNAMLEIVMYSECHMPAILLNLCMMPIFLSYNNKTTD